MESYSARANTLFCTFVTVLGTAACLNHLTVLLLPGFEPSPEGAVEVDKIHELTFNKMLEMDQSTLSFHLDHNLTSEFNWNMNQLFVYLVATYNDTKNKRNEVTIWDRIVRNEEDAWLSAKKLRVEYPLRDQFTDLRGQDIRLHLRYRTMPITGFMFSKEIASTDFTAPLKYFRDNTTKAPAPKAKAQTR
mmetsp:Transcript_47124/g.86465  ORF Transcript_47124/g.86465 Transcript_47124/m.86465 type:complete len:190 (-) Transcript_47124:57-626(-)